MVLAAAKPELTTGPEISAIEKNLVKKMEEISGRIPAAELRVSELKAERETLVIPARVEANAGAQKRIREIDQELIALEHDLGDDRAAVGCLSSQLDQAQKGRVAAKWESERASVRKTVAECRDNSLSAEIVKSAQNLASLLRKAEARDQKCSNAMIDFDPRRYRFWSELGTAHEALKRAASLVLIDLLPFEKRLIVPQEFFGTMSLPRPSPAEVAAKYEIAYSNALAVLDDLELEF
jgi:chromosome segregation ATPase